MLCAVDLFLSEPLHIVLAGTSRDSVLLEMLDVVRARYIPNKALIVIDDRNRSSLEKILPFVESMRPIHGAATAYVCVNRACRRPVTDTMGLARELDTAASSSFP